jgi:hypothetical protein
MAVMRRWVAGWVAFAVVCGVALSATAQGFPKEAARLEYERRPAAASCPDEAAFRQEVAILRHARDDFLPADPYDEQTVVVRITLDRAGGRYRGTLTHVPPAGTPAEAPKVAVNSECEDLLRDLAFLATFFLPFLKTPQATVGPVCPVCPACAAPAEPVPVPARSPSPAPAEPSPFDPPRCDPEKIGDGANDQACKEMLARLKAKYGPPVEPAFWLSTGGLLTLAYTSEPGPGFSLGADARGRYWSVGVEAQVTFPAQATTGFADEDFDASTFVGMLVPCARWNSEKVHLFGCGALGAGGYLTYDSQAPGRPDRIGPTIRIGPRLGLELPFGDRFAAYLFGEVSFAPIFKRVTYYETGRQWVQNPASVFLGAGFSVKLAD